jgi:hypothetical protein
MAAASTDRERQEIDAAYEQIWGPWGDPDDDTVILAYDPSICREDPRI